MKDNLHHTGLQLRRRSYGYIARANLPIEVFRTERPTRSRLRRFFRRFFLIDNAFRKEK